MALTPEQLHELGMAVANVEAAVGAEIEVFRAAAAEHGDHAHVIGDALVFSLAMKGFVVKFDPDAAAFVAAMYERSPEQLPKLS